MTAVVAWATMANGADPRHCVVPFVAVAVRVSVKPEPTGRPPMTPEIVLLWLTSIDPARAKPAWSTGLDYQQ